MCVSAIVLIGRRCYGVGVRPCYGVGVGQAMVYMGTHYYAIHITVRQSYGVDVEQCCGVGVGQCYGVGMGQCYGYIRV